MKGDKNITDVNSKPQISSRSSVRSRNVLNAIRELWGPQNTFPRDIRQIIYLTGGNAPNVARNRFLNVFPECALHDILMGVITVADPLFGRDFYVQKIVWNDNSEDKTVTFIAGPNHQPGHPQPDDPNIDDEDTLEEWQDDNPWYGRATCTDGEIIALHTSDVLQIAALDDLSARRCGFASFLSYLCFLDNDHLVERSGYQLSGDMKWRNPNMRQIQSLGFNNRQCRRIIYIRYEDWAPAQAGQPGTMLGNKAIIYGAAAAGYYRLVTYRRERCQLRRNCCLGGRRGRIGNTFKIRDLLDDINKLDPAPRPKHLRPRKRKLINFQRHYGKHWYFCKKH